MNIPFAIAGIVWKEMYRRKDFYVLFILTALLTVLTGAATFFNDAKIVGVLKEVCLNLIWISSLVIALTTAARQIPAERESRTIFPLLAKPVTRWQVIFGKFLGCWFVAGVAVLVFYTFFGVVVGARTHSWPLLQYAQAAWLHWTALGVVVALAILGSIVFSAPSVNVTICFIAVTGMLTMGGYLHSLAARMEPAASILLTVIYFLLPHLEWAFDYKTLVLHDRPPVQFVALAVATAYWAFYTAALLTAAWLAFRRKTLTLA
jgi:ABC-type transport system involved in multi-copper enzyme maturation permease subunit